jgi:hypothetical protein
MFRELTVQSGLEIAYSNRNLDRIERDFEHYMGFSELPAIATAIRLSLGKLNLEHASFLVGCEASLDDG